MCIDFIVNKLLNPKIEMTKQLLKITYNKGKVKTINDYGL